MSSFTVSTNTIPNKFKTRANATTNLDANQLRSRHLYNLIHATSTSSSSSPLTKLYSLQFDKVNNLNGYTTATTNITNPAHATPTIPQQQVPASSSLISHKICRACGVLLIPGLNVSIRITYPNNKSSKKRMKDKKKEKNSIEQSRANTDTETKSASSCASSRRRLRFKCLSCGSKTYESLLDGSKNQKSLANKITTPAGSSKGSAHAIPEPSSSSTVVNSQQSNQSLEHESTTSESEANTTATATTTKSKTSTAETSTEKESESQQPNHKNKSAKQRAKKRKAELNLLSNLKQRKTDQSSKLDSLNLSDFLK